MEIPWDFLEMAGRLFVSLLAAAPIGWEREHQEKPAGLRTHMMVSLGACAFMVITLQYCEDFQETDTPIELDPLRVTYAIVGGVGFLGAGTIVQSRFGVRGITTAASLWVVAAIGTGCGMGYIDIALTCTFLSMVILWLARLGESFMDANLKKEDDLDKEKTHHPRKPRKRKTESPGSPD